MGEAEEKESLCQEFVVVTGTDSELARHFLKQASWKIESALNMFFDDTSQEVAAQESGSTSKMPQPSSDTASSSAKASSSKEGSLPKTLPTEPQATSPSQISFVTWNIDGLCPKNVEERTLAACKILKSNSPDIIFLQEVIPTTHALICERLSDYTAIPANDRQYFTLVLLKKASVARLSSKVEHFPGTAMGRALQIVECQCAGVDLRLMCSHLESTGPSTKERQQQFSRALYLMKSAPKEKTVLFGGDTNLRDNEVAKVGLPAYVHDLWDLLGSPPEGRYTWDLVKNDNLIMPGGNRPRLRFDRLYLKHAAPAPRVVPETFRLLGTERLPSCGMFPSDHWGILCTVRVLGAETSA